MSLILGPGSPRTIKRNVRCSRNFNDAKIALFIGDFCLNGPLMLTFDLEGQETDETAAFKN